MFTSCLNACACAVACVQRAEDNLQQSALSHHSVGLQGSNTGHQALFTYAESSSCLCILSYKCRKMYLVILLWTFLTLTVLQ